MCSSGSDYIEENEYERELFRQSEKLWQSYQDQYIPLENQTIEQIQAKRSPGYRQYSQNQAVNAARMQNSGTTLIGPGMDPSGGGYMNAAMEGQNVAGTSNAMGSMAGLQSVEDQYLSGMMGLSQAGRGQQSTALQGMSGLASKQAGIDASELAAKSTIRNARWGTLGTLAGMGTMVYGSKQGWFDKT